MRSLCIPAEEEIKRFRKNFEGNNFIVVAPPGVKLPIEDGRPPLRLDELWKEFHEIDINACYNYHLGYSPLPVGNYEEIKDKEGIKRLLAEEKQGFLYFQLISSNNYYRADYVLNIRYLNFFAFEHKTGTLKDFSDHYYAKKIEHHPGTEVKKYRKEDILAVRTDCLLLKTAPTKTSVDGEILAHGFRIIERREKSVLVERQYYKEDGRLETKRY
ncbi:3726_t:CDS:2 [Cetraspora pellucida]|uniref:3726_t:CDS:1 n=1 Tax=Cetraspora pellucida TaxID=1433469 RepID=A0ACA9N982_9GLOM|nr:3726_t:CDS:2 [Cetraspora pellucida]